MHVRGKSGADFSADSKKVLIQNFSYLTVFHDSGFGGYAAVCSHLIFLLYLLLYAMLFSIHTALYAAGTFTRRHRAGNVDVLMLIHLTKG